jgi:hypothetical protein
MSYTNHLKAKQTHELALPGTMHDYHEDHLVPLRVGGHWTQALRAIVRSEVARYRLPWRALSRATVVQPFLLLPPGTPRLNRYGADCHTSRLGFGAHPHFGG